MDNKCVICLENEGEIFDYEHDCGTYHVHRHCLQNWLANNNCECMVCRKKLLNKEEEQEIIQEYNLTILPETPQNQETIINTVPIILSPVNNRNNFAEAKYNCMWFVGFMIIFTFYVIFVASSK